MDTLNTFIALQFTSKQDSGARGTSNSVDRNRFILDTAPHVRLVGPYSPRRPQTAEIWYTDGGLAQHRQEGRCLRYVSGLLTPVSQQNQEETWHLQDLALRTPETVTLLGTEIGKLYSLRISSMPNLEDRIDLYLSTTELGLDLIVAIKMRGWWKFILGFAITTRDMLGEQTL